LLKGDPEPARREIHKRIKKLVMTLLASVFILRALAGTLRLTAGLWNRSTCDNRRLSSWTPIPLPASYPRFLQWDINTFALSGDQPFRLWRCASQLAVITDQACRLLLRSCID